MCKKLMFLVSAVMLLGLVKPASAVVVDGYREWNERIQLNTIGDLEITATGHAKFTARVDQDAVDVTIAAAGILESQDMYKLPDDHPEPTTSNVYVNGTWNANNIESKGTSRAAYIYVGATGVINIQIGYGGTAPYENPADYDPLTWLADNSLLVDPSLNPAAWFIQITDMGGGAAQITAESLAPQIGFDSAASGDLESVSPAELIVTLSGAEEGQTYTVDYAAVGGTATAGADYVIAGGGPACWGFPTQCHGDTDNDGEVKGSDFLALKNSWYKSDPDPDYNPCADFDRDGEVKGSDFLILKNNWYQAVEANCPSEGGSATLEFAPGEVSKTISIDIVDDGLDEEDETIIVELSNPAGPNVVLGEPNQHVYTIEDPRPEVSFEKDSSSGREDVSPAEITVNLSFASTETVTVDYAVTGGTATGGGVDYTLDAGTLTFNAGETTKTISIAIVNDGVDEQNETIVVELSNPSNAKLGDLTEFTYTIIDPSSLNLKIDFALPFWWDADHHYDWEGVPIPGTLKDGWIPWCAGRWGDMYGHGAVAMENVAGTGVSTMISTVYGGLSALKVCGMCMPSLNSDTAPYGSPIHDPICNSWYQVEDHIENPSGDIIMALYNLPAGEYELYSYHNNFECHRNTPACCDLISNPQPLMPSITALSLDGLIDRYAAWEWWPRWMDPRSEFINCMPQASWDHPVCEYMGDGVEMIEGAYNVPVQQVTSDDDLVPSLIKFRTDGSAVHIVYESGCCVPDGIRPHRVGGRAILNAFELILIPPPGPACWDYLTQCHGDTDNTGDVKGPDFLSLKNSWYKCYPDPDYNECADFDRDGCVKGSDFLILKNNWYQTMEPNCPTGGIWPPRP